MKVVLRAIALFVCVACPLTLAAQPVPDGTVNSGEYTWSSGDWRMSHDETYLYVAKTGIATGGIAVHLDVDPRSTPTAGDGANGNLDTASMTYGSATTSYTPKLPFRGDARVMAGPGVSDLQIRDGSGGWTSGDGSDVTVGTGGTAVELRIRWDGVPGLTERPAAFNWMAHQLIDGGGMTTASNPAPSQNTSNGARIEYFYNVATTTADPFADIRSTWIVTSNADSGTYSLRSSIDSANNDDTSSRRYIVFDLGLATTISPATELPMIIRTVTIDGTAHFGYTGQGPIVVLDGPGPFQNVDGFTFFNASNCEVRGLSFGDFTRAIVLSGGSGNTIAENWLGYLAGNTIGVQAGTTTGLTIGGTNAADRNLIVNNASGIVLDSTTDAQILGNRIGIDGNDNGMSNFTGIDLISTTNTMIGAMGAGNVIGSNTNDGIHADATSTATILGNLIGLASDGLSDRGNGGDGIDGGGNLTIGSLGAPNSIANNSGAAIRAAGGNLLIRYNSIFDNGSNIIVTAGQPVPTVSRASVGDGTTMGIEFSLSSSNVTATAQSFQLDLYRDIGGPKIHMAASPCYEATSLTNMQWTVGTGFSASDNYFLMATSYEDFACSNPADGTSQALAVNPDTGSASSIALQSPPSTAWAGSSVTFTATVTASPNPTGTVTFRDNGVDVAHCTNAPLTGGQVQCSISFPADGAHAITAIYNGDAFNGAATSSPANVTVQTHTFTGTGSFFDSARWTNNTLPGSFEDVRIEGNATFGNGGVAFHYGEMTIAAGAQVNWTSNYQTPLRVTNLTSAGTIDMTAGGILQIAGEWAAGGTFIPGIGTVIFDSASVLPDRTFFNLAIHGSMTSSTAPVTINGTLTVGNTAAFTPSHTITLGGDVVNGGTLTFASLHIPTGETVNATGSFNAGAATIDGTLIPTASTVIGGSSLTGTGTLYVTSTATDSFGSQYTMGGQTLANLTAYFAGAAAQTLGQRTYGNLTIDNNNGVSLAATALAEVTGTLYLKAGKLATAGAASFRVTNPSPSAITWLQGWITGENFDRTIAAGTESYTFPIGLDLFPAHMTITFNGTPAEEVVSVTAWTPEGIGTIANGNGIDPARDANVHYRLAGSTATSWIISAAYENLPDVGAVPSAFVLRTRQVVNSNNTWLHHQATAGSYFINTVAIPRQGVQPVWISIGNQLAHAATSEITAGSSQLVNNGTSSTTIAVQVRDVLNVNLLLGGDTVTLSTNLGTLSAVTDHNNGMYTATLTAGTTAGTATITGTVNGVNIPDNATVVFDAIATPAGIVATATGANSVTVTWNPVGGATGYQIFRSAIGTGSFSQVGVSSGPAFSDATASANTAYLYRVRAVSGSSVSGDSAYDVATTVIFTDSSLSGATVKVVHFTELRTAVNAMRTLAGLGAFDFTSPSPATNVTIRKAHVDDLRTALAAARSSLGLPSITFTDPTLTAGSTAVKAVHLNELRAGVQ